MTVSLVDFNNIIYVVYIVVSEGCWSVLLLLLSAITFRYNFWSVPLNGSNGASRIILQRP